jgi:hypothetical protein
MVEQHRSFPSIYTWVIYNEGWGQLESAPETYLAPRVLSLDPTRLVNAVSGWTDHGAGDYSDNHHVSYFLYAFCVQYLSVWRSRQRHPWQSLFLESTSSDVSSHPPSTLFCHK